uniref:Matrix protein n=1 Tax=Suncus murinus rhabdovirus TaxID=3139574 RepID=A0AB38ZKB3_9RHAB
MFSKIRKSFVKSKEKEQEDHYADSPPDYYGGDFFDVHPTAPVEDEVSTILEENLSVEAELVIRTKAEILSMKEMLQILGSWIDKCSGPVRQRHLDTWMYLCLGLHLRKDPTVKTYNIYRAATDMVIRFRHAPRGKDQFNLIPCNQQFELKHKGQTCDIYFSSIMSPTKRKGCPAHIVYNQLLKNGKMPPKPIEVFDGYDVEVLVREDGTHEIFDRCT